MLDSQLEKIINLAQLHWRNSADFAEKFDISTMYPVTRDVVKTVGIFYHGVANGGVERVISLMTPILTNLGYRVIIITDEPPQDKDYSFPPNVDRVVLDEGPCWDCNDCKSRAERWLNCIETYEIDVVIYHAWLAASLFWDMTVVKSTGAAFVVYTHSVFIAGLIEGKLWVQNTRPALRHADAICVLSNADLLYWQQINPNVFLIQNPNTLTEHPPANYTTPSGNILWLARFAPEKNPGDALEIMQRVHTQLPHVKLTMVGDIPEHDRIFYTNRIKEMGLENNVLLPGYSSDVGMYYKTADLLLATSDYEGYMLTVVEAYAYHVPVVSYEMPHLATMQNTQAAIQVPWKDFDTAAEVIVHLLTHPDQLQDCRQAAAEKFRQLQQFDYTGTWQHILDAAISTTDYPLTEITHDDFRTFSATVDLVTKQLTTKMNQEAAAAEQDRDNILNSARYKVGKSILWLPSKIRTALRLLKDYGLGYVVKLLLAKEK